MKRHLTRQPLLLPSPTNAIPCDFNRVWLRMTARECLNVCSAYGLITAAPEIGDELGQMPADLTAEGALAWMSWNQGRGNYYFGALDPLAPKKIANAANMTLWLDALDRSTLLDGSSIPVNDGGKVATWSDKSGAGHHFTQTDPDHRPEWHADGYVNFLGGINSAVQLELRSTSFAQRCGCCRAIPRRCGAPRAMNGDSVRQHKLTAVSGVAVGERSRARRRARKQGASTLTARERSESCPARR